MKNKNQRRQAKGDGFLVCLFLVVFLTSGVCADINPPENDLFGVLENDLLVETDSQESNTVTNDDMILESDTTVTENAHPVIATPKNDLLIAKNPTTPIQRKLWKARISTSGGPESNPARNELEQIIRQIHSIEIKPKVRGTESAAAVETVTETEPNEMVSDAEPLKDQEVDNAKIKTANGSISEQTLQRFKDLSQKPDQLKNPLELAEILFNSGCLEESAVCYRVALNRKHDEEVDVFQDKAWILLQLGNCLKNKDPQAALENYRAVITEFPYSSWAQLAKAKSDLITWYLKDQPKTLIDESKLSMNR